MFKNTILTLLISSIWLFSSCQKNNVQFDGDLAFERLKEQCDFGPRNPGSTGYIECKEYLIDLLTVYADTVFTQAFSITDLKDGKRHSLTNIIAQFKNDGNSHILFGAHWDTRPWADMDPDPTKRNSPILGANDGASGVAVLLELARMFKEQRPTPNITIALFDGEDLGLDGIPNSYAQGSKYFAQNLPIKKPDYGIVVDMIGDTQLEIPIERNSYRVAPELMSELWESAERLNLPAFQNRLGYDVYDDHIPLWEISGIPTINLIDMNYPNQRINYWHTTYDIPGNCSVNSLQQVGQLLAHRIYNIK